MPDVAYASHLTSGDDARGHSSWLTRRAVRHALGFLWLLGLGIAVLWPALSRGSSFGSFDLLSQLGVLKQHGVVVHNTQAGDQVDSVIPWMTLAWRQVHQGHLPLWNPNAGLGMPLAFAWQAAPLSPQMLLGYLFPQHLLPTVEVVLNTFLAGSGVYVLARVLGQSALASVFAGTVYELSGPVIGWLGWPHSPVMAWAGWWFATAILVIRGRRRLLSMAGFAAVMAAMIYSGSPEIVVLFAIALATVVGVVLLLRATRARTLRAVSRPFFDLVIATLAGAGLGAPLLLPGYQVSLLSQRAAPGGDPGELVPGNPPLPAHNLIHLVTQGFDGIPIAGNHWFGYVGGYSETAAYIGVIGLVLAIAAVPILRRRSVVVGFAAAALVMLGVAFFPPLVYVLARIPGLGTVLWQRGLQPLALTLAVLGGFGLDLMLRGRDRRGVARWIGGGFCVAGLLLLLVWAFGRGHLPPSEASIRSESFLWPTVATFVGLAVVCLWVFLSRRPGRSFARGRLPLGMVLLACETAFLIAAGSPVWTASPSFFGSTPAEVAFSRAVGSSLVGFGAPLCFFPPGLGIPPNSQIIYGVKELTIYDPMVPSEYFTAWEKLSHQPAGIKQFSGYCPVITSTATARLYGVRFIIEPMGARGPRGSSLVASIQGENLYEVPGSYDATLTGLLANGTLPPDGAPGSGVAVSHPDPASWSLVTDASTSQVLRLRLTNLPGWHAQIDGRSVPLSGFAGIMIQTVVPAGHHTVVLSYWPTTFTIGIVLALLTVAGFVIAAIISIQRRRKHERSGGSTVGASRQSAVGGRGRESVGADSSS